MCMFMALGGGDYRCVVLTACNRMDVGYYAFSFIEESEANEFYQQVLQLQQQS